MVRKSKKVIKVSKQRRSRVGEKGAGKRKQSSRASHSGRGKVLEYAEGLLNIASGGFGFVRVEGRDSDIFIPQHKLRGALNNDKVRVAITKEKDDSRNLKGGKSCEGEIAEVLERSKLPYIGILSITRKGIWVIIESRSMPYDVEVIYPTNDSKAVKIERKHQGLKVAVLVKDFPKGSLTPRGIVTDILGKAGENDTEMHSILTEYGLPYKFTDEVEMAADGLVGPISEKEIESRKDFRNTLTFTIDPADAKDFDDAVSFKQLDSGNYEVGVHIADVSYYVRPKSILDNEAYERGTSVYLVDRTVPMLPEALSNNLCSLRPGEDKLCFSAVFEIDPKGKVLNKWLGRTIINSDFRFAYEEAQQIIDNKGVAKEYKPILTTHPHPDRLGAPELTGLTTQTPPEDVCSAVWKLHEIATVLRKKRFSHGSISFERPEMKIVVDENGKPLSVIEKITKSANWLIEEFMLLANKEVAKFVAKETKAKVAPTFVYRVHDEPNMEKIEELRGFVHHFGYKMEDTKNPRALAKALNKLLDSMQGKPECETIELMALRCMARAIYTTDNIGHYGLGFDYYTHFTSPIRRYPDLMVHRLLLHYLNSGSSVGKQLYEQACEHCSNREQLATEAERSSIKLKMTEYMQDRLGEEFDGTIISVTEWGMYVSVEPTKIEGMISVHDLTDDYYTFDEKNFCLRGQAFAKKYMLGDRVRVRVKETNIVQKTIDFELVTDRDEKH